MNIRFFIHFMATIIIIISPSKCFPAAAPGAKQLQVRAAAPAVVLIQQYDEQASQELIRAANNGYIEQVKALLRNPRVNVNAQTSFNPLYPRYGGRTALILAAAHGNLAMVQELLKHPQINVNFSIPNSWYYWHCGWTALMEAASKGDLPIVQVLLAHKDSNGNFDIDVNIRDNGWWRMGGGGRTAKELAQEKGYQAIVLEIERRNNSSLQDEQALEFAVPSRAGDNTAVVVFGGSALGAVALWCISVKLKSGGRVLCSIPVPFLSELFVNLTRGGGNSVRGRIAQGMAVAAGLAAIYWLQKWHAQDQTRRLAAIYGLQKWYAQEQTRRIEGVVQSTAAATVSNIAGVVRETGVMMLRRP